MHMAANFPGMRRFCLGLLLAAIAAQAAADEPWFSQRPGRSMTFGAIVVPEIWAAQIAAPPEVCPGRCASACESGCASDHLVGLGPWPIQICRRGECSWPPATACSESCGRGASCTAACASGSCAGDSCCQAFGKSKCATPECIGQPPHDYVICCEGPCEAATVQFGGVVPRIVAQRAECPLGEMADVRAMIDAHLAAVSHPAPPLPPTSLQRPHAPTVESLRHVARMLEEAACYLEDQELYVRADQLRGLASELRHDARGDRHASAPGGPQVQIIRPMAVPEPLPRELDRLHEQLQRVREALGKQRMQ